MRLNRRSGRNNGSGKWRLITIVLTLTMAFGLMGTAAAYWSDSLFIDEDITTGKLGVRFVEPHSDANVQTQVDQVNDHILNVTPITVPNDKFVNIHFKVENMGTVPVAFGEPYITQNYEIFSLTDWNLPDRVDPSKTKPGDFKLWINAPGPGIYYFEAVIPARAWNQLGPGGWTDELYVKGIVTIVEDENSGNGNSGNGNSGNGNSGNGNQGNGNSGNGNSGNGNQGNGNSGNGNPGNGNPGNGNQGNGPDTGEPLE